MTKREDLRRTRKGTVINVSSRKMESLLMLAVKEVIERLEDKFDVSLEHSSKLYLKDITDHLSRSFPDIEFKHHFETSFLSPDGGFLFMLDGAGKRHTILISEAKRQGTNDVRASEGLAKQSRGNAIERLGKNVIGFRSWMATESIIPFVVFGEGVDFDSDSSILDRVSTIAMFAPLNEIESANLGRSDKFNRGSFFFRSETWTTEEMFEILFDVAQRSIFYYFSKYGEASFLRVGCKS